MKNVDISANNAQAAADWAQIANAKAKKARDIREKVKKLIADLDCWSAKFTNAPVALATFLFFLASLLEIYFSFPIYIDLMARLTIKGSSYKALLAAMGVVSFGAVVSHYIAKRMSKAIFNYSVANLTRTPDYNEPQIAAEDQVRVTTRNDFYLGLVFAFILLGGVIALSWQRAFMMGKILEGDFSLTDKLVPVICVLMEIWMGVYLGYLIVRTWTLIKLYWNEYLLESLIAKCVHETKMGYGHYQHAVARGEKIQFSKDLTDVTYRYEERTTGSENYIDAIPERRHLKVTAVDGGQVAPGVHLTGVLPDGSHCNSIWTNEEGEAILTWDGDEMEVLEIIADGECHKGPYRENASIKLPLRRVRRIQAV